MACGRRFGKTILGKVRAIRPMLDGHPVAWFAPEIKYLREAWDDLERTLRPVVRRSNQVERKITLVTGGSVEFWSMDDKDAGRSRMYKHVVIDEAAKARHLAYSWPHAIRPTLADLLGTADLLSTPRGHDFFWQSWCRGLDDASPEWASFSAPTHANPYIAPSEIEAMARQLPERVYRQEILAEFLEDAGGVFRNVKGCVEAGRSKNEQPVKGRRYTLGADLARLEDFTVLCVLDSFGRQVHFERFNQVSWERVVERIAAVAKQFDANVVMDSTGVGDPPFEAVRKRGCRVEGYTFTSASKERLIDGLAIRLEASELRLMDVPIQTNELIAYQYEMTPSRNIKMGAPEGMHDDCVIALALAAHGLGNRSRMTFL